MQAIAEFGALGAPGRPRPAARRPDDRRPRHRRAEASATSRDIVTGQKAWCQLFSEPGAGSDLAGLNTAADQGRRRVGRQRPEGVDLGRPGRRPRHAASPAPTPTSPKHQGITYFAIDMHQPGVEVRPLRGDDRPRACSTRCSSPTRASPTTPLIGGLNNGWAVANTTLMFERSRPRRRRRRRRRRPRTPGHRRPATSTERAGDFVAAAPRPSRGSGGGGGSMSAQQAAHRAGQGQRQDRRPDHPPGAHAAAHAERDRAATRTCGPAALRRRGQEIPGLGNIAKLSMSEILRLAARPRPRASSAPTARCTPTRPTDARRSTRPPATRSAPVVTEIGAVRAGAADLRRHRPDPAQHHRRAGARPPQGARHRQGQALPGAPQERLGALGTDRSRIACSRRTPAVPIRTVWDGSARALG